MNQNAANNAQRAGPNQQNNQVGNNNAASAAPNAAPTLPGHPGSRYQLAYDAQAFYPVDIEQIPDLLPYQIFLLQTADDPTLTRYKDRLLVAYYKSLQYVGRMHEADAIIGEKARRLGNEGAFREMARDVDGLFGVMLGPGYEGEVRRNAAYMGGRL